MIADVIVADAKHQLEMGHEVDALSVDFFGILGCLNSGMNV